MADTPAPSTSANGAPKNPKLAALMPSKCDVVVGEETLVMREPVLKKFLDAWNAIDDELMRESIDNVVKLFSSMAQDAAVPLAEPPANLSDDEVLGWRAAQAAQASKPGITIDTDVLLGQGARIVSVLRDGVVPVLTTKLADVVAIALDSKPNRQRVAKIVLPNGGEDLPASGRELTPEAFREWVADELTGKQAVHIMRELVTLVGLDELGKWVRGLIAQEPRKQEPKELPAVDPALASTAS